MLEHIASELESDMSSNGWVGKTVTLKYKLDTYQGEALASQLVFKQLNLAPPRLAIVFTRAKSLSRYISSKEELFSVRSTLLSSQMPCRGNSVS